MNAGQRCGVLLTNAMIKFKFKTILIFRNGGDKLKNLEKKLWGSLRPVANIVGVGAEVLGLPGSHFWTTAGDRQHLGAYKR